MLRRWPGVVVLVGLLAQGCDKPNTDDEAAGETTAAETTAADTTTGEPDPCEGLMPDLPLFSGITNSSYGSGQLSLSSCEMLITVLIAEDQLVEGTDADYDGNFFLCGCNGEWDCGYQCGGPTRVTISHVDEHCVVGTLSEAGLNGGGTDTGTDTGPGEACIPAGGFILRR